MSLQTMKTYLYDLFYTVRSEVIRNWVNIGRQNKIKYSDFVRMTNFEDSVMFGINIPQDIVYYLETKEKELNEYKGINIYIGTLILFTRGIKLNEKDFDLIAQGAIYEFLNYSKPHSFRFSYFPIIELGYIIEKLILPYLIKQSASDRIITFLIELSKDIQLQDDFFIGYHRGPNGYREYFQYSDLDYFNPVKEQIKHFEKNSKI